MAKRQFKVQRQLTISKVYRKWEDYAVGDIVIGEVVGTHKDQYGKDCPVIKVEEAFFKDKKLGASVTGKNLVLNSTGMLAKAMKENDIQIGHIIQVEYKGTSVIDKGPYKGKDAHVLQVDLMEVESEDESEDEEDVEL